MVPGIKDESHCEYGLFSLNMYFRTNLKQMSRPNRWCLCINRLHLDGYTEET